MYDIILPPTQLEPVIISPRSKRPRLEAYHSSASNAEYTNTWKHASNSTYVFMVYYLTETNDSFTFKRNFICGKRNEK